MSRIRWGLFATAALTIAALGAMPLAQAQSPQARPNTVHLEKSPLSGGVLMARAIRAGLIHLPGGTNGAVKPPSLNCKPAPCALPNVQASGGSQPVDEDLTDAVTHHRVIVDEQNPDHVRRFPRAAAWRFITTLTLVPFPGVE